MRILAISNHYPPDAVGGYEWAAHDVLTRLSARGHEVDVLTARPDTPCPDEARIDRALRRVRDTDEPRAFHARWDALRTYLHNAKVIQRSIRRVQPEVLYLWSGSRLTPAAVAASEASGVPLVLHLEDNWVLNTMQQDGSRSLGGRLSKLLRGLLCPLPRYDLSRWSLIFVSRALQGHYEESGLRPAHSAVVHNGYDPEAPPRPWPENPSVRARLGFVGRVHPVKGLDVLLTALELRRKVGTDDVELSIYGNGEPEYVRSLHARTETGPLAGRVIWHGAQPRSEMLAAYRTLDLLIVPSVWEEPFGLVAIEGLGAGVPVVASCRGGLAEIVDDSCGWSVNPDEESLLHAIDDALSSRQALPALGRAGRARVETAFAWKDKVDRIETILTEATR